MKVSVKSVKAPPMKILQNYFHRDALHETAANSSDQQMWATRSPEDSVQRATWPGAFKIQVGVAVHSQ